MLSSSSLLLLLLLLSLLLLERFSIECGKYFKILDSASTRFQLKIKEAVHILWEQPSLNSQVKHLK